MVEKNNSDNNKILVIIKTGQKQSPSGYPLPSSPPPSSPPQTKSLLILVVISANFFNLNYSKKQAFRVIPQFASFVIIYKLAVG